MQKLDLKKTKHWPFVSSNSCGDDELLLAVGDSCPTDVSYKHLKLRNLTAWKTHASISLYKPVTAGSVRFKRRLERASTTSTVPSLSVQMKQFDVGENVTEVGRPLNWRYPSSSKYHSSSAAIFELQHGFGVNLAARPGSCLQAFIWYRSW